MEVNALGLSVHANGDVFFLNKRCARQRHSKGYRTVAIPLHRLIACAFHGTPPTASSVCHHKDGNPNNNAADNLQWVTQAENTRLHFAGKPRKLSERSVAHVLSQRPTPQPTLAELAARFGISYACARAIRSGRSYKNGWYKRGGRSLLTLHQYNAIVSWQDTSKGVAESLARTYRVSVTMIYNVWNGTHG